jgi:hypothetical protein
MPYTQYGRKLSPEHRDCLPVYGRPTIIAIGLQPAILPGVTPIFFPACVLFPQKLVA